MELAHQKEVGLGNLTKCNPKLYELLSNVVENKLMKYSRWFIINNIYRGNYNSFIVHRNIKSGLKQATTIKTELSEHPLLSKGSHLQCMSSHELKTKITRK